VNRLVAVVVTVVSIVDTVRYRLKIKIGVLEKGYLIGQRYDLIDNND
jgi:hypothetical protein